MADDDAPAFTPTDKLARARRAAERRAGQHPAGYRPHVEPEAIGTLAPPGDPPVAHAVYECGRCGALTTYDGADVHAHWHLARGDMGTL